MYLLTCAVVFLAAYLLNTTIITVFYHRGLAHNAVELSPGARKFAARLGEGYQNNHHRYPASAKFSYQPWELDLGFGMSTLLEKLGVLQIQRGLLIPSPPTASRRLAHD
jgi:stearoyl-CoA desaturase (delta-9 desaturase)